MRALLSVLLALALITSAQPSKAEEIEDYLVPLVSLAYFIDSSINIFGISFFLTAIVIAILQCLTIVGIPSGMIAMIIGLMGFLPISVLSSTFLFGLSK